MRLTFYKEDMDFSLLHVTMKTSKRKKPNASTDNKALTAEEIDLRIGGFTLTWFIDQNQTRLDLVDFGNKWEHVVEPKYKNGLLKDTLDLVSQTNQQGISPNSLQDSLLRQRWTKEILQQPTACLTTELKNDLLKSINTKLSFVTYSEVLMSDKVLEYGTELFFCLHYCMENLQESVKLSIFYEDLLKSQSLKTITLATINNVLPRTEAIEDFAGMVEFFNELDRIYSFTNNLTSSMMAISTEDQLHDLVEIRLPFIDGYKDATIKCLEQHDCRDVSNVIKASGTMKVTSMS